jgi:2-C-methyl-D-erythritol 2,4-cyclodiphosphate synthase
MTHRIGIGYDLHRLVPGRPCVLGGVAIPHSAGPLGHSDGDALLHALADALLGAAGLEDLGSRYPDGDPRWKGADSAALLADVARSVGAAGFAVENVDLVVVADAPRIAPWRAAIRARVAEILGVPPESVNVKGKSTESLAPATVAAHAVALLRATGSRGPRA